MTQINQIQEFASNAAAGNVMTTDAYAGAASRLSGHVPGIADMTLENAVLRQLSRFCRGVAQFIAARHAAGVVDDGDVTKIVAGLEDAIAQIVVANAPSPAAASETLAGILKLTTGAQALAGTDDSAAMTALKVAAVISGVARAYTRQQYNAPVARTGQSGSQDIDCDLHQFLSIIATGSLAFAAPTNLSAGKTVTLKLYSASTVSFTWDAAYMASSAFPLPTGNTAGKWMLINFFCHKSGYLLCTGWSEEA